MDNLPHGAFDEWYKLAVAAGLAMVGGALLASHNHLMITAVGLLFLGFGEFINHPIVSEKHYRGGQLEGIATGRPRRWTIMGTVFGVVGIGLLGLGLYRIVLY